MNRYPNGHEFEFKLLRPSQIKVDKLYQRELNQARISRIVNEFNGDTVREPHVSFRDGIYWVFDGQHTLAAWRQLHNGNDKQILCKVFRGMTWLDEKDCFVRQNGIAKDPTSIEKLKAEYNGGNPAVLDMVKAAHEAGVGVRFTSRGISNGYCVAVSALYDQYNLLTREAFVDMLQVIMEAWGGESQSLTQYIIRGLGRFYKFYYGDFKRADLVKSLKRYTPDYIIRTGKDVGGNIANKYAMIFLKTYNKQRTTNRLEDRF